MVYRIYVEKKDGLDHGAAALKKDIKDLLGIKGIEELRTYNRYDVENISEELFENSVKTVFSEPQTDDLFHKQVPTHTGRIPLSQEAIQVLWGRLRKSRYLHARDRNG